MSTCNPILPIEIVSSRRARSRNDNSQAMSASPSTAILCDANDARNDSHARDNIDARDDNNAPDDNDAHDDNDVPDDHDDQSTQIQLSPSRWLILFAICVFGLAMTLTNDTSSILDQFLNLLDLDPREYLYINQIFGYLIAITAVPTSIFVDRFGTRGTIIAALCLYVITTICKLLLYFSSLPGWSSNKLYYYIFGGMANTECFALFFLLPLKVSESWFSESERSLAWTLMIAQLEAGVCFASFFYARLVKSIEDFKYLAYMDIVLVVLTTVVCASCITKSEPPNPPSKRMAESVRKTPPFWLAVMKMITHTDLMLHMVHSSVVSAIGLTVAGVQQDILASIGYSQIFAGEYMSLNQLVAIVMMIITACFVHKIVNIVLACKLGSFFNTSLYLVQLVMFIVAGPTWVLVCISILLILSSAWVKPHFNNMTAQLACGTVSQAAIVAFAIIITTLVMSILQLVFASLVSIHEGNHNDYSKALSFLVIVGFINEVIYLIFFQGRPPSQSVMEEATQILHAESDHED